jgi:hypothetical protein
MHGGSPVMVRGEGRREGPKEVSRKATFLADERKGMVGTVMGTAHEARLDKKNKLAGREEERDVRMCYGI